MKENKVLLSGDLIPTATAVPWKPGTTTGLIERFERHGFLVLKPEAAQDFRTGLMSLSKVFGAVVRHVLSDSDGIVTIEPDSALLQFGNAFTYQTMELHTDGAFVANPPNVVALQCEIASGYGGTSCMVDGRLLFQHLREAYPEDYTALFDPDAMTVVRGDETATQQIFSRRGAYTQVSFRLDKGVRVSFSPRAAPLVADIQSFLRNSENQISYSLQPGEILVLDNRRMLHGRGALGEHHARRMNRLWFDGNSPFGLGFGFETTGGNDDC